MATDAPALAAVRASLVEGWTAMLEGDLGIALDTVRRVLETELDLRPRAAAAALAAAAGRRAFDAGDRETGMAAAGLLGRCLMEVVAEEES
jgi:hypothetical protein